MQTRYFGCCVLGLWALGLAIPWAQAGDEKAVSAEYASWAKFKVGTVVHMTEVQTVGKTQTITYSRQYTLKELKDNQIRVEQKAFSKGIEDESLRVTFPIFKDAKKEDAEKPSPTAVLVGKEKIKVGDKEFQASKYSATKTAFGEQTMTLTWVSADIPGYIGKMETYKGPEKKKLAKTSTMVFEKVVEAK